mmetsp:Transcript_48663/g.99363  ORF Transcript_48663/g.99363 Transcript_48663/m.99363 type:complete len:1196 (+) Transcript_48663:44-3631(+)
MPTETEFSKRSGSMSPVDVPSNIFAQLPDVDDQDEDDKHALSAIAFASETKHLEKPPQKPPGHGEGGDASMCPFAMMAAMASGTLPERKAPAPQHDAIGKERMNPTDGNGTDESACPFATIASLMENKGKTASPPLEEEDGEEKDLFSMESMKAPSGIPIECPMSGHALHGGGGMDRTSSFRSKGSHAMSNQEGSRAGGTIAGRSMASSRRSTKRKGGRPRVKRTKRLTGYSTWEAQTYIPVIKLSWAKMMQKLPGAKLGLAVYDILFSEAPSLSTMFQKQKEIMAVKFAEMLMGLVENVEDPTALYEQLKKLAPMHVERGVSKDHLPFMQVSILKALEVGLGPDYNLDVKSAWEWMWTWVSETLLQTMDEVANDQTVITRSWDMALDNYDELELAGLLFDTLFEIAPNLRSVYSKPRQTMSVKFMDMLSTLVSFHGEQARVEEQITWLGIRHVHYNAKRQHTAVMQEVLLTTMARAVGADDWSEEIEKAWTDLWQSSTAKLFDVMEQAELHGERVRELWARVQARTTLVKFGSALRKALLSGTEWVQSLSSPQKGRDEEHPAGDELDAKMKAQRQKLAQDTFSDKSNQADNIGTQFWNMLTSLLDLMWQPERQNEKLIVMTTLFFECGIRSYNLDTIGESMLQTMSKILGDDLKKEDAAAWRWWWNMTKSTMARTLDSCEQGHAALVRTSWEKAKEQRPLEELGEYLFQGLATLAPHVIHIFKRPKKIQAMQFVNAVELLVTFNEDPGHFFEELKGLTIRHIKYGVKPDYAKPYGKAVLRGMEELLGDDFDAETKQAWICLWEKVSNCVIRALSIGSNLVIVSLIQGDLEKLVEAMGCTPRGERFRTLTEVEVNGEVLSPLKWAIQDGKIALAKYIIDDLLTIRADRHAYYYGREILFKTHPDIVRLLAEEAPVLLEALCNGLMWHSHTVYDGKVRVNYYIREMYGCPEEMENVWETPLGVLALKGDPQHFTHPVIVRLIDCKWRQFGSFTCMALQCVYIAHVALFFAGFVSYGDSCDSSAVLIRYITGGFSAFLLLTSLGLMSSQLHNGLVSRVPLFSSFSFPLPRFLQNQWNSCRCISNGLIIVATFMPSTKCDGVREGERVASGSAMTDGVRSLSAVTAVLMGLQLLEVLILSKQLSAFAYTISRLVRPLLINLVVCAIAMLAFTGGLVVVRDEEFDSVDAAMLNLAKVCV